VLPTTERTEYERQAPPTDQPETLEAIRAELNAILDRAPLEVVRATRDYLRAAEDIARTRQREEQDKAPGRRRAPHLPHARAGEKA
jgi:hypothetical protein